PIIQSHPESGQRAERPGAPEHSSCDCIRRRESRERKRSIRRKTVVEIETRAILRCCGGGHATRERYRCCRSQRHFRRESIMGMSIATAPPASGTVAVRGVPSREAYSQGTDSLQPGLSACFASVGSTVPSRARSRLTRTLYSPGTTPWAPAREPVRVKLPS